MFNDEGEWQRNGRRWRLQRVKRDVEYGYCQGGLRVAPLCAVATCHRCHGREMKERKTWGEKKENIGKENKNSVSRGEMGKAVERKGKWRRDVIQYSCCLSFDGSGEQPRATLLEMNVTHFSYWIKATWKTGSGMLPPPCPEAKRRETQKKDESRC